MINASRASSFPLLDLPPPNHYRVNPAHRYIFAIAASLTGVPALEVADILNSFDQIYKNYPQVHITPFSR